MENFSMINLKQYLHKQPNKVLEVFFYNLKSNYKYLRKKKH
jgi:hypothetical protein